MSIRWDEVAERIRAMVRPDKSEEMNEMAAHLGVGERLLQDSMNGRSRLAAMKVIAALVRRGVDPKWMLTGEVDPSSHRRILEGSDDEVENHVKRLVREASRRSERGRDASALD
jgi:hypothetical protein